MEQIAEENAESIDELVEEQLEGEIRLDDAAKHSSADSRKHPESSESYQHKRKMQYKKVESKEGAAEKYPSNMSDLERLIGTLRKESAEKSSPEDRDDDTIDGAVAIIYNKRKGEFVLEVKPDDYGIPEFRGKIALIGGTTKIGESSPETLVRELREEDPDSYKILLKALKENGYLYDVLRAYVDGRSSHTYVYAVEIKDEQEWAAIKSSKLAHDAGHKVVLSIEEVINNTKKNDWAFTHGDVIKQFIAQNWVTIPNQSPYGDFYMKKSSTSQQQNRSFEIGNKFSPFTYADSIIPKHSGLSMQILNSKDSQQYKTQFQISSRIYSSN